MARRPEDMGRNMARSSNPLSSQLAPSFPTPAIDSLLHDNTELAPLPPAVVLAPQQSSYLFDGTMPQAAYGTNSFQQGGGAGRISGVAQPVDEAALVAALNNFESQPFQPNGHVMGWPLGQQMDGPQTHQQQVPRYPGPRPIGPSSRDVWGLLPPMPPASNARFTQQRQATGAVAPYGNSNAAGAPLVGSNRYVGLSWAPRPTTAPAYLAGSGSGGGSCSSARTGLLLSKPTKSFEEFLCEQGIAVPVVDDTDDDECDVLSAVLLRDQVEKPGRMESAGLQTSAAGSGRKNWLLPPAVGFRSGPSHDQPGLGTGHVPMPSFGVGGRSSYGRAEAAAAREERRKKVAEKKVATAKARAQRLAGTNNTRASFQK